MKTLLLTALACRNNSNKSIRTHCNYSNWLKLHKKSCDSPYKVELLTQKRTRTPLTIEFIGDF